MKLHKSTSIIPKEKNIFLQGAPSAGVYHLSQGKVKISITSDEGKDVIIRIISPGELFGHRSVFTGQHYCATATAIEVSTVCFIEKEHILDIVNRNSSIGNKIIKSLAIALGNSEHKVASFPQRNVFERVCETLLLLKENYGQEVDQKIKLNIKLKRSELASIIGTSAESLVRTLSDLKRENIIELKGKNIIIIDEIKLKKFAKVDL